jgi:hypothetical protein
VQLDFAAHIRNPDFHPPPRDVEPRRMQIYLDLFFKNVENFLATAFPVAKSLLGEQQWLDLAREFVHLHPSESPYFLQISEEFLTFVYEREREDLPGFYLELCHYEWVELSLDVAVEPEYPSFDPEGDLMGRQQISRVARALTYTWPVHLIGVDNQPGEAPEHPTYLVVYRGPDLRVRFMESNVITHRLLELLNEMPAGDAIERLCRELNEAGRSLSVDVVKRQATPILEKLRRLGILLGTVTGEDDRAS